MLRAAITIALARASGLRAIRSYAGQASRVLEHGPFRTVRSDCRQHASEVRQKRAVLRLSALKHSTEGPRRQPTRGTSATARL